MKRNKNQDWTRVLQERLQDAQLPAPDDFASWAGQESPAFPARSPKNQGDRPEKSGVFWPVAWWPWALGSVAVAAFAGLLFLRTPDHHWPYHVNRSVNGRVRVREDELRPGGSGGNSACEAGIVAAQRNRRGLPLVTGDRNVAAA